MVRRRRSLSHLDGKRRVPLFCRKAALRTFGREGGRESTSCTHLLRGNTCCCILYDFLKCAKDPFSEARPIFYGEKQNGIMEAAVPLHGGYFQRRGKCPFLADTVTEPQKYGHCFAAPDKGNGEIEVRRNNGYRVVPRLRSFHFHTFLRHLLPGDEEPAHPEPPGVPAQDAVALCANIS